LIQELKLATNFPMQPIKVDSDKRARAEAVDSITQALNYLREQPSSSWGLFKVGIVERGAGELNADLWDKIARNEPLTEEEFDRLR
jgi:hypothetical protein